MMGGDAGNRASMRSLQEHLVVPVDDSAGRRAQLVYARNEFVRIEPFAFSYFRSALYGVLLVATGGLLLIASVWFPQLFTRIARAPLPSSRQGDAEYMLVLVHEDGFRSTWIEVQVHRPIRKRTQPTDVERKSAALLDAIDRSQHQLAWVWFEFKKHRYVFNQETRTFERYLATVNEDLDTIRARVDVGLDDGVVAQKTDLFGANLVDIDPPAVAMLFFTKVVHPYYLFQIFSIVVWMCGDYVAYACVVLGLSAISLASEIYAEVSNSSRLRELVRSDDKIQVCRTGAKIDTPHHKLPLLTIHETDLVPGDIVELTTGAVVADVLLLSGGCIVDEAALTGEAVPINKEPARGKGMLTETDARVHYKSSFLHAGSRITRVRESSGPCRGVVLSTGFSTGKGELFRSILFPRDITFEFERDSYRYLAVLATIALAAFIKRIFDFADEGYGLGHTMVESLDLVTIAVPPALPLVLSSGIVFALERLKKCGIFCIDSKRINSCGQLDTFCFDKTGTLTEETLKLVGVDVVVHNEAMTTTTTLKRVHLAQLPDTFRLAMGTCHSLQEVDGELQGYSLELSMFDASQLTLEFVHERSRAQHYLAIASTTQQSESGEGDQFGVVKRFPFDAACQRSSVVVENLETKQRFIFVKGSPEAIRQIALDTPPDFQQKTLKYAAEGNYCIGFGVRELAPNESVDVDARAAIEADVTFMGIALFDNELKPESRGMIAELYEAAIDVRMITGDNALTAVHVARLLEMQIKREVAIVDVNESDDVVFHCVDAIRTRTTTTTTDEQHQWQLLTSANVDHVLRMYDLALTGAALEQLRTQLSDETMAQLVLATPIFARIRPTEKAWIVERLMDAGKIVGMCGDGTNDCGALKAAHVGLALSSAEASIVAPFTSKAKAVTDVPALIREGRCALTTSFLGFKFMVLYPVIQLGMASTLGNFNTLLTNTQYIWDDLVIVLSLAISMLYTAPSSKLTRQRPPNTLFSLSIVASIVGQIVLYVAFFAAIFAMLTHQSWFCRRRDGMALVTAFVADPASVTAAATGVDAVLVENCLFYTQFVDEIEDVVDDIAASHEDSQIWLFGHMVYFSVALAFNLKDRYRQPFYTNYYFTGLFCATLAVTLWFLLDNSGTINSSFQLVPLPVGFRWTMFGVWVAQFVAAQVWELFATWTLPQWRLAQASRVDESHGDDGYALASVSPVALS